MKAKASFIIGGLLGLLAGSRIGPGLYKRAAAGATAVANHPAVRRGASTASDKASHAAKFAGNNAAVQVKQAGSTVVHRFGERWHHVSHSAAAPVEGVDGSSGVDGGSDLNAGSAGNGVGSTASHDVHNGWTGAEREEG